MAVKLRKGAALGSLSITPLIDVVFLLLIFFLVATRFAEEDRELDVVLPSASAAQPLVAEPQEVFVNVDQTGAYYIDGRVVEIEHVERLLRQAVANNPAHQAVVIRADKNVKLDAVVQVMNVCNKVGVQDYSLTTAGQGGS